MLARLRALPFFARRASRVPDDLMPPPAAGQGGHWTVRYIPLPSRSPATGESANRPVYDGLAITADSSAPRNVLAGRGASTSRPLSTSSLENERLPASRDSSISVGGRGGATTPDVEPWISEEIMSLLRSSVWLVLTLVSVSAMADPPTTPPAGYARRRAAVGR